MTSSNVTKSEKNKLKWKENDTHAWHDEKYQQRNELPVVLCRKRKTTILVDVTLLKFLKWMFNKTKN